MNFLKFIWKMYLHHHSCYLRTVSEPRLKASLCKKTVCMLKYKKRVEQGSDHLSDEINNSC